jgi:hypothetical protein
LNQAFNALLIGFLGEMLPAGKRWELDGHFLRVAEAVEDLAAPAGRRRETETGDGARHFVENTSYWRVAARDQPTPSRRSYATLVS